MIREEGMGNQVLGGAWVPVVLRLFEQFWPVLQRAIATPEPEQGHDLLLLVGLQVIDDRLELEEYLVILMVGEYLQRPVVTGAGRLFGNDHRLFGMKHPGEGD
ncbi:hypothetical protein D9M69_643100 [compost metagenome]